MKPIEGFNVKEVGYYWYINSCYNPDKDDDEWEIVEITNNEEGEFTGLWMWTIGSEVPVPFIKSKFILDGKFIGPLKRNKIVGEV